MKNKSLIFIAFLPAFLASCAKTNELYPGNAYDTGSFATNYYLEYNKIDQINIDSSLTFNKGIIFNTNPIYGHSLDGVLSEDQTYEGTQLEWNLDTPKNEHDKGEFGIGYGPTYNFSTIDSSFSYGFLSRLYDGRVRCDGLYARSRVQINKTGYGTFFPKEMVSGKYFAVALRGETSCDGYDNCFANVNFKISFYKHNNLTNNYQSLDVLLSAVKVYTNTGGNTYLLGFYFNEIYYDDASGNKVLLSSCMEDIVGMSMSFALQSISSLEPTDAAKYGVPSDDMNDENNPHFALMLYEVMLPKSTWR